MTNQSPEWVNAKDNLRLAMNEPAEISLIVRHNDQWLIFHSYIISIRENDFTIVLPKAFDPSIQYLFGPDLQVGVSFRLSNRRLTFSSTVLSRQDSHKENEASPSVLVLSLPPMIRRVSNRIYERVPIPRTKQTSAMFWPGGLSVEPSDATPETPSWIGDVTDLGIGGCRILAGRDAQGILSRGDIVGLILQFDDLSLCRANAHIVHMEATDQRRTAYGIQFAMLDNSIETKKTLSTIENVLKQIAA